MDVSDTPPPHTDSDVDMTATRVVGEFERQCSKSLAAGLYIVSTPLGNLGDITLRGLSTLASADAILCEDTRHSAKLLNHFSIRKQLIPLHDHNEAGSITRVCEMLADGKVVALVSDAGTPLISDPGFKLARAVAKDGHLITAIPGASAPITALTVSGLPSDRIYFGGFLPAKQVARRKALETLSSIPATLVLFESPNRLAATLTDAADVLGDRPAVVTRELTKLHETVLPGSLSALASQITESPVKGEIVLLIAAPEVQDASDADIRSAMEKALRDNRLKDAARQVAEQLNVPKNRVYDIGLEIKNAAVTSNADAGKSHGSSGSDEK